MCETSLIALPMSIKFTHTVNFSSFGTQRRPATVTIVPAIIATELTKTNQINAEMMLIFSFGLFLYNIPS
ncbi:unnamed protein product [Schistosoma mattheei]|uniref:Uncharacterized protein n=1 Tax=Schistosoma mattheei TaxID=31246 RepID=A0A183P379_9TREM|nr:unnamed protein product [Schistosoma mattheei]